MLTNPSQTQQWNSKSGQDQSWSFANPHEENHSPVFDDGPRQQGDGERHGEAELDVVARVVVTARQIDACQLAVQ